MKTFESERPALVAVGDRSAVHLDARQIRYSAETGQRVRVRRGVYVDAAQWRSATSADRYLLRVEAVVNTRRHRPVLGYWSAAAVWGYKRIGQWGVEVHIVVPPRSGAHSRHGIRFHRERFDDDEVTEIDGFLVTTPARTLIDLARTGSFRDAVVALDSALDIRRPFEHRLSKDDLLEALGRSARSRPLRGIDRALRMMEFADGRAASPGESLSRIVMLESGFPSPELQTEHPNPRGGRYFTDFEWPEHRLIGEFDGVGKYLKEEFFEGRSPGEVVYDEKVREDHLRAEGNTVVRWGWHELHEPGRLIAVLTTAGLPYRSDSRTALPPAPPVPL